MSRLLTSEEAVEFKKIIDSYQPNSLVLEQFKQSNFGVIAGPAGAGKDTLRDVLVNLYPGLYLPILSTTTRPPRAGETDGQTYHFSEVEAIRNGLQNQEFFQAALVHNQQISCLHISEVQKLMPNQWGLSILIPYTEAELSKIKKDIKTIFLIAPSTQVLINRINSERLLGDAEIKRRLQAATKELEQALNSTHYFCIVSDTVEKVVEKAHQYFSSGQFDQTEDTTARNVINQIMLELSDEQ